MITYRRVKLPVPLVWFTSAPSPKERVSARRSFPARNAARAAGSATAALINVIKLSLVFDIFLS